MPRAALALLLLGAAAPRAHAQSDATLDTAGADSERYTLRAEAGLEYDSNAHRAEIIDGALNPPIVGSLLERAVLSWTLSDVIADGQAVSLAATAAGKLFDAPAARDEDVAIAQSSAAWQRSLGAFNTLSVSGLYYEAFQARSANLEDASQRRDFRSLAPSLQIGRALAERFDLGVSAGYRMFVFKPDRDDDFDAPTAGLELRWARRPETGADLEVATGAAFERRTFGGPALVDACPPSVPAGLACSGPNTRVDDFVMAHLDATRTGRVLVGAGYAFHDNLSNSFGETVRRHFGSARFAAALPGGLMLAARAELLFATYRDRLVVGQVSAGSAFVSIEDENRSNLRVDLSRALADRLRLLARYTFYANELGNAAPLSYRRQTWLLSLAYGLEK